MVVYSIVANQWKSDLNINIMTHKQLNYVFYVYDLA